jgi:ankyrin repeat protein
LKLLKVNLGLADKTGASPLHRAAGVGNIAAINMLVIEAGIDVNIQKLDKSTPAFEATLWGQLEALTQLQKLKADLTLTNNKRQSLVHIAAFGGHSHLIRFLAAQNLDLDAPDNEGNTQ